MTLVTLDGIAKDRVERRKRWPGGAERDRYRGLRLSWEWRINLHT